MANKEYTVSFIQGDSGFPSRIVGPTSSTSNRIPLVLGDTVTITRAGGNTITAVSSGMPCNRSLPYSLGTAVFTANALGPRQIYLTGPGGTSLYIHFEVSASADTTPDNWTFGPVSNGKLSHRYIYYKRIEGISTQVQCSVSGPGNPKLVVNNSSTETTSVTVRNGDRLQVRATSPSTFDTSIGVTVTCGTASAVWNISTAVAPDPNLHPKIPSNLTLPISLDAVGEFFGKTPGVYPNYQKTTELSKYLYGGPYIPNIVENSHVPSTLPIKLSDLVGTYTSLYFSDPPVDKGVGKDTTSAAQSITTSWALNTDFSLGYGENIGEQMQYRVTLLSQESSGDVESLTGPKYSIPAPGAFSAMNRQFSVSSSCARYTEAMIRGLLKLEARHPKYPSTIVSTEMYFTMLYYGP